MTKNPVPDRLTKTILQTADDLHRSGILTDAAHQKITLRHLAGTEKPVVAPIDGGGVRDLREKARMSQAVFARHLMLTVGYVSQLERGAKKATGPVLVLLDLVRRKGMDAIL